MARDAALAGRLRSLFDDQTGILREYLSLTAAQARSIEGGDLARFGEQVEAERALLDRLEALRRVSEALEPAYREAFAGGDAPTEAARAAAAAAAAAVARRTAPRRAALDARRADVADRLQALQRALARSGRSAQPAPGVLDISR